MTQRNMTKFSIVGKKNQSIKPEKSLPRVFFADTAFWKAVADNRDEKHEEASSLLRDIYSQSVELIISDYVFSETLTLIRLRAGHQKAMDWSKNLLSSKAIRFTRIDEKLFSSALSIFSRYNDQTLSFVDCSSFALIKAFRIKDVLTFDSDFRLLNVNLWPR
jgi:predicted nucleic acid-binding protein